MLRGILLDIDGTLLLSNDAHAQAWSDALHDFGYDIPWQRIQPLIGMGGDKLLATLVSGLSTEEGTGKEIADHRQMIFLQRYLPSLKQAPGSRELVAKLRDLGMKRVVATSAKGQELEGLLHAAGIADLVEEETTSDDVEHSKPAPDIVHAALAKGDLRPEESLLIGDTPYDVESASKARVGVVAVRCGGHDDEDLSGALAVYEDPADLLAHLDESPISRQLTARVDTTGRE